MLMRFNLVQYELLARFHARNVLFHEIENAAGCSDNHVHDTLQTHNVVSQIRASSGNHDLDADVLA